jgi:parallel beta-helix repeat protein
LRLNQICRNKDSGVTVRDAASAPVIERNSIEDNGNVGVRIYGGGGELTRNRVVGNARSGLIVEEHSRYARHYAARALRLLLTSPPSPRFFTFRFLFRRTYSSSCVQLQQDEDLT